MVNYRHRPTALGDPCPWLLTLTPEQRQAEGPRTDCCQYGGCVDRCYRKGWMDREKARKRRQTGPRAFPMPSGGNRGKFGYCRWCGGMLLKPDATQNKKRGWHDGRGNEPHCLYEFYLHTRAEQQRAFVVDRDGEKCWDCGEAPMHWRRGGVIHGWGTGPYIEVTWCSALELEHEIPLWLIAHKPDDERRRFFGPENLRLRCARCHGAKTALEAADRAKGNRLRNGGKKLRGRRMQGRPFQKGHRPLRG